MFLCAAEKVEKRQTALANVTSGQAIREIGETITACCTGSEQRPAPALLDSVTVLTAGAALDLHTHESARLLTDLFRYFLLLVHSSLLGNV